MTGLLFIPLDDRPATRDAVLDLAAAAGVPIATPEPALLGSRVRPADVHALWSWIHGQVERTAPAACVASIDMLCFGGLVASRTSTRHWRNLLPWLDQVYALAGRVPAYLSAVIPRTPVYGGGNEDPPHWQTHGDALRAYSAAADQFGWMGDIAAGRRVAEALERLPSGVVETVLAHRRRHLLLHAELIVAAALGKIRSLLLGQDDTTAAGLSRMDREALERLAHVAGAGDVRLASGADELGAVLFARWLNEASATAPTVRVVYTFPQATDRVPAYESLPLAETVREHVEAAGCRVAAGDEDILLWVHNFDDDYQREAQDQQGSVPADRLEALVAEAEMATAADGVAALADVRFANGADGSLVERLLRERHLGRVAAYAGWNTAGNALGSAIAQAVTIFHIRASTVPGDEEAAWRMLALRLLDDWGYQVVVRPRLAALVRERGGDGQRLGSLAGELAEAARRLLAETVVPPLTRSLGMPLQVRRVAFPWDRLFEAAIELEPQPTRASPNPVIIADYDTRWPGLFDQEKVRITEALGEMVAAVEHVGSTAVPGLAAKPILDILVGVAGPGNLDRCVAPLVALGYEYVPAFEMSAPNRRYFRRSDAQGRRTHHIHAVPHGTRFWRRHLLFRDYLRQHPESARAYGELKRRLAADTPTGREYTFAKSAFVRSIEAQAAAEGGEA